MRDIIVNKLVALADRTDAKDYADVYFALRKKPKIGILSEDEAAALRRLLTEMYGE